MDDDQWWMSLTPERKHSVRRWLDPDDHEQARRAAAAHPDQLALLPEEQLDGWEVLDV